MTADELQRVAAVTESPNKDLIAGTLVELAIEKPSLESVCRRAAGSAGVLDRFEYIQRCYAEHVADRLVGYENWIDPSYPVQDYSDSITP